MTTFPYVCVGCCALAVLASSLSFASEPATKQAPDSKALLGDSAIRQAQLRRVFENFRNRLIIFTGRLEVGSPQDQAKAKSLRSAIELMNQLGTEARFDTLIRSLSKKNAACDLDVLGSIVKENADLRKDLQQILALMLHDDSRKLLADKRKSAQDLLAVLKDLRNKEARLQAATEKGKPDAKELANAQEKLRQQTSEVGKDIDPKHQELLDKIRKPLEGATSAQDAASKQLQKNNRDAASDEQGRAIARLDEAIQELQKQITQLRQEEREQTLNDLLSRSKRMLVMQLEVEKATVTLFAELQRRPAASPTLADAGRINKLADEQREILKETEAAQKVIRDDGNAVAFAEIFDQLHADVDTIHDRLVARDVGVLTQKIEADAIATLRDIIQALEKSLKEPESTDCNEPRPGPAPKPRLVNTMQQLKMIFAMQGRIHARTQLYAKSYHGEQAPKAAWSQEITNLSKRQERLAQVTREIAKTGP